MSFDKEVFILLQLSTYEIDFLNKVLEGYEGATLVTTENPDQGLVRLHTSKSMKSMLLDILKDFPREVKVINITE